MDHIKGTNRTIAERALLLLLASALTTIVLAWSIALLVPEEGGVFDRAENRLTWVIARGEGFGSSGVAVSYFPLREWMQGQSTPWSTGNPPTNTMPMVLDLFPFHEIPIWAHDAFPFGRKQVQTPYESVAVVRGWPMRALWRCC